MKVSFLFILMSLVLVSCTHILDPQEESRQGVISGEKYTEKLTDEERIELIRERRKELDSIRKWDFFVIKNNPEEALAYYLQVAEKLPEDVILKKKIWHAYYLKKDWYNAYAAYIQTPIWELSESERIELLSALFFDESQTRRLDELSKIALWTGELDTYKMIDVCYTGIHNCIVGIEAYSWGSLPILKLQSSITDAEKISPDYQYRNFIVASKLYDFWYYRAAALIAREILENRPGYTWVEKLLGFSLYEIGNYPDAKKYLLSQLERAPKDMETILKLWDIAFLEHDYPTANLYFNNAILAGYTNKTDIERKLAYSYSKIGDMPSMMKVLAYLLEEKDATADDAAVAISLALQNGENIKAYVWASNAIKKYRDSVIINALYLTALRTSWKLEDAQEHLYSLQESMLSQPIILLEKAILLLEYQGDLTSAKKVFETVRDIDPTADFALEAQNYIEFIANKEIILDDRQDQNTAIQEDTWWQ